MIDYINSIPKSVLYNGMFILGITLIVLAINRQITNKK